MYHLLAPSGDNPISLPGESRPARASWASFAQASGRLAAALGRDGLSAGVVAVEGKTSPEVLLTIFAAWQCGCAVTVLPPAEAHAPGAIAAQVAARRRVLDVRAVYLARATWDHVPAGVLDDVLRIDESWAPRDWLDDSRPVPPGRLVPGPVPAAGPDDVAIYQPTSGTTAEPRLVPVTWSMLLANLAAIAERLGLRRDDRFVSWMPLYHDMGLVGYLVLAAYLGASLSLIPADRFAADPGLLAETVERERGTFCGMTTYGLALLERALRRERTYDLSSLGPVVCAAEMVDIAVCDELVATGRRHGLRPGVFAFAYGLAEATLAVSIAPCRVPAWGEEDPAGPGEGWLRPPGRGFARLGRPLVGVEVRVVRGGAGPGPMGEIEVRGPSVMAGYAGPASDRPVTPDGWMRTGDLGYLSPGGEVVVVGRSKDILVVGGRKVAPDDVERVVGGVAGVRRGRVAAVAGRGPAGEGFSIVAERDRAGGADARAVRVALRRQLGVTPLRVAIVAPGALPRTTSGKLRRRACHGLLSGADGPGPPPAREPTGTGGR